MGFPDRNDFWNKFSYVVGSICLFIGAIELIFGFQCAALSDTAKAEEMEAGQPNTQNPAQPSEPPKKGNWWGGGERAKPAPTEPSFTVNVTPGQVAQGANWAANNAGTVAAVANAAAPAAPAAGAAAAGAANPFFGNNHLDNNRQ